MLCGGFPLGLGGKSLQQPIWRLCALDGSVAVATSVTLGLATVESVP